MSDPTFVTFEGINGEARMQEHPELKLNDAEVLAELIPEKFAYPPEDFRRYGIVPNSSDARAANDTRMRALLNSDILGPIGRMKFVPEGGSATTYYFGDFFPSRDGIIFDGGFCTLDIQRTYVGTDDQTAFFYFVRNSGIENATINVDYDGSAGVHAGNVIRIGNREDNGAYFQFGLEDALAVPMGTITLRNLRISTNNPVNDGAILMLGGVRDLIMENVVISGGGACSYGFLYEFGTFSENGVPSDSGKWSTAHASNLIFRNVRVGNLATSFSEGAGIALGAAYNVVIENLHVDTAYNVLSVRTGESLFYLVAPYDEIGSKRCIVMKTIVGANITSNGIQLIGSESAGGGYLSAEIAALDAGLESAAQSDLGMFSLDGFAVQCDGDGVKVSGACDIRNGVTLGCASGISISDLCPRFNINNVECRDSTIEGIRADFDDASPIAPNRRKTGAIRNCKIVGSAGIGISLKNCEAVLVECNQIGYHTDYDPDSEATQTVGVNMGSNANGVILRGNFVSTSGGAAAYSKTSGPEGCTFVSGRGTKTLSGLLHYGGPPIQSNVTFSSSMTPDCMSGSEFVIAINASGAYTMNAPLNPMSGMRISFTLQNVSGGAAGAATWNAAFKMTAWTNPANGFSRSIAFRYDVSAWTEVSRTAADVPN